ncbi:acyl-[acyl-carrier-protein] thioesterase [Clostridium sp. JS66]|uniref:acyl-[acyl-carrier-protein] thioesterase n=1 Tax=Clostridium sp. JS66 TaxID=3064705 RepID=UPI00298D9570|nr:acyl-ACP thioesterase domain-containing protein [Clostridium sp. JS66]WPC41890.1 thioesterase [Clostridium sp. JS66]
MKKVETEKQYEIQYYEIDCNKKLLLTSLMNYLEDVCTMQSEDIGIGLDYMKSKKVAWVLYKWNIHIYRYPLYREKVKVKTIPESFRKFYAYRSFQVFDSRGNVIADANSIWFLINTERRKAMTVTEDMYEAFGLTKEDNKPLTVKKIRKQERVDNEKIFSVRYSDIDTNRHVNNVKYVDWAVETVPLDIVTNCYIVDVIIAYEKETTYGDMIKVLTQIDKKEEGFVCLHRIVDEEDKELALIETLWENEK